MSETVIRINKRLLERVIFLLIIVVLLSIIFFRSPAQSVDVEEYEVQIADLQAQIQALEEAAEAKEVVAAPTVVNETPTEEEEPQETPEPEVEEESALEIRWNVDSDDGRLTSAIMIIDNGLDTNQELEYTLTWDNFDDYDGISGDVFVRAGGRETVVLYEGSGFLSNPPDAYDTLKLEVEDSSGTVVQLLEESIR